MAQHRMIGAGARAMLRATGAAMLLGLAVPQGAHAQFSDSYKFLEAVRKGDTTAILKEIEAPGVTLVNTRDRSTGETPLLITIGQRDLVMTNYFLSHGARPDLADNNGRTPLMLAVEKRFVEGVQLLLGRKASPNQTNSSGETPLMRAVQLGDLDMVQLLLAAGGDPNRRDTLAGMSAIDYAQRDKRGTGIVEALLAKQKSAPAKGVQGPQL